MSCYYPIPVYETWERHPTTGGVVYSPDSRKAKNPDKPDSTWKCGKCIGCASRRAMEWAMRGMHEAKMHDEQNTMLTLTYKNKHLPEGKNLSQEDVQLFLKRFRKELPNKIRYQYSAEYGPHTLRPHYHMCVYGWKPDDLEMIGRSPKGHPLWRSEFVDAKWGLGKVTVSECNFNTSLYTAKYTMKFGKNKHRLRVQDRVPEFNRQSNGLGLDFFNKFYSDMYPSDEVLVLIPKSKPFRLKPPEYYDRKYAEMFPEEFEEIKKRRIEKALKMAADNTPERLEVKEEIRMIKLLEDQRYDL